MTTTLIQPTNEQMLSFFKALSAVQAEIEAPRKSGNNQHMRYKYTKLVDIHAVIRESFAGHGMWHFDVATLHATEGSPMPNLVVTTYVGHFDGGWISTSLACPLDTEKGLTIVQVMGKVNTYLRRYNLMNLLGLAPSDDTGEDDDGVSAPSASPSANDALRQSASKPAAPARDAAGPLAEPMNERDRMRNVWMAALIPRVLALTSPGAVEKLRDEVRAEVIEKRILNGKDDLMGAAISNLFTSRLKALDPERAAAADAVPSMG